MSTVHLRHVRTSLRRLFSGVIDMSDCPAAQDSESHFLSRALAAYTVLYYADVDEATAAKSVTDGFNDNGIDAIFYDQPGSTLWVVQAKWFESAGRCPKTADIHKLNAGVLDLANSRWERFNERIRARTNEITRALDNPEVCLHLVLAYPGSKLATHVQRQADDMMSHLNDASDIASLTVFALGDIHKAIVGLAQPRPINLDILLSDWGHVMEPYPAFYGTASTADMAASWKEYGQRLLSKNIRQFLGDTAVNEAIQQTLHAHPEHFWYFNNGITFLCSSITRTAHGLGAREVGVFQCSGVSLVNGAQTIGSLGRAVAVPSNDSAKILVRLISLEGCPEEFAMELTKATNTQNKVERRDFVSLDPQQARLRDELYMEGKTYVYKSGDSISGTPEDACSLEEATAALACSSGDIGLAVLAKKEIGKLWEDLARPPYTTLFNDNLTGSRLWRLVQVARVVDKTLKAIQVQLQGMKRHIAVHGSRFILYEVFRHLPAVSGDEPQALIQSLEQQAGKLACLVLDHAHQAVVVLYPDALIGRLFYNVTKCRAIADAVESRCGIDSKGADTSSAGAINCR